MNATPGTPIPGDETIAFAGRPAEPPIAHGADPDRGGRAGSNAAGMVRSAAAADTMTRPAARRRPAAGA